MLIFAQHPPARSARRPVIIRAGLHEVPGLQTVRSDTRRARKRFEDVSFNPAQAA
ncbi:MAG: hypothetical protein M3374_06470 [Pseudomonadota bacterium]|nr:hypothetical protein [Pseudomonadota bacterium]